LRGRKTPRLKGDPRKKKKGGKERDGAKEVLNSKKKGDSVPLMSGSKRG